MKKETNSLAHSDEAQPDARAAHSPNTTPSPNSDVGIPKWLVPAAFLIGVALLLIILVLVVKIPKPTETQFIVFRIIIALGGAAFSMALTGFLTIRMHLPKGGQIVAGGALAVFIVLYFASPAIPVVPKPQPLIDPLGHLLESPANENEMEVLRLQDAIVDTRQYMESEQYPESQKKLEQDDPYLAQRILAFDDDSLNPRRRYIKYEYAEYAYVNAAAGAMYDDHAKADEYASLAIKNADVALKMVNAAERTYQSDKDSQFLLDWVNKDQGKDRVLYFRAMAECMLATAKSDSSWQHQAGETWNLINLSYQKQYPAEGTRQLDGCVVPDKSK